MEAFVCLLAECSSSSEDSVLDQLSLEVSLVREIFR